MASCYPDQSIDQLRERLHALEDDTRILQLFRKVNSKVTNINFKMNNILIFPIVSEDDENKSDLEIISFSSVAAAIDRYNALEKEREGEADIVLVRADNFENLRIAFRNYFADTTEFVQHLDDALGA